MMMPFSLLVLAVSKRKCCMGPNQPCFVPQSQIRLLDPCKSLRKRSRPLVLLTNLVISKNSPYAWQYDKPGMPYSRLLAATGCTAGPGSVQCLQQVPYEVPFFLRPWMSDYDRMVVEDAPEYQQCNDRLHPQWSIMGTCDWPCWQLCPRKTFAEDSQWKLSPCTLSWGNQRTFLPIGYDISNITCRCHVAE